MHMNLCIIIVIDAAAVVVTVTLGQQRKIDSQTRMRPWCFNRDIIYSMREVWSLPSSPLLEAHLKPLGSVLGGPNEEGHY